MSKVLDEKRWNAEDEGYSGAYLHTKVKLGISLKDFSLVGVKLKGWIVVKFTVVDNGGLDRVVIWVESGGERVIYLGGNKSAEIEEEFKIGDLLRLIYGGFDVRVNATDLGGNWATGKTHIDSALETLKKGLMALFEIFKEVARVLAKVASMLIDALKKIIMKMFKPVLEPIQRAIKDYGNGIADAFIKIFTVSEDDDYYANLLYESIIAPPLFKYLIVIGMITQVVEGIASAFSKLVPLVEAVKLTISNVLTVALKSISKMWWKLTLAASIGSIFGLLVPSDSPFWAWVSASGTTLVSIFTPFIQAILAYHAVSLSTLKGFGVGDLIGFALAIAGWFITTIVVLSGQYEKYSFAVNILGTSLTGIGLIIALGCPSPIDKIDPLIGSIDELIDAGLLGYSLASCF